MNETIQKVTEAINKGNITLSQNAQEYFNKVGCLSYNDPDRFTVEVAYPNRAWIS